MHYKGYGDRQITQKYKGQKKGNRNIKIRPGGIRTHAWPDKKAIFKCLYLASLKNVGDIFFHNLAWFELCFTII